MAVSAPFGAMVRFVKLPMFRFEPCVWQKTRTSSQLSIEISLPGTFIDTSTVGSRTGRQALQRHDAGLRREARPAQADAAVGLLGAHAHRAVDPVAVRVDVDQLGLLVGGDAVFAVLLSMLLVMPTSWARPSRISTKPDPLSPWHRLPAGGLMQMKPDGAVQVGSCGVADD